MLFGFDPATDLTGNRVVGTFVVGLLMLVLLGVAGLARRIVFRRDVRSMTTERRLFSLLIGSSTRPLPPGARFVLQDVELIKHDDRSGRGSNMLSGFLTARTHLYRLFLDFGEERMRIEEGTYPEETDALGRALADFLGIPFATESL